MEKNVHNQEIYLKINLRCCDDCPKKLKQALLKMKGIYFVIVDQKRKMVMVVAEIDPQIIVNKIKKMGKTAKIIIPNVDNHPKNNASHGKNPKAPQHCCSHENKETAEDEDEDSTSGHESDDCQRNKRERKKHYHQSTKKKGDRQEHVCESIDKVPRKVDYFEGDKIKDDDHQCESYEKAGINPNVCTDFYCKLHAQRGLIYSKVPPIDSEDHPCHISNGPFNEQGNSWFDQSVPAEYFPQGAPPLPHGGHYFLQGAPPLPPGGHGSYPTQIMRGNHDDINHSRWPRPMPMPTGYNDGHMAYSGRPVPMPPGYNDEHMAYSGRPMPMPMPTGYNDEHMAYSGRPMHMPPGYNDEHMAYSGRPMHMPPGYNDEYMAYPGKTMPLTTGYNNDGHNTYSGRAMHYPGGYNNNEHTAYSGGAMPYSGECNNPGYNNEDYTAYSGRSMAYPRGYSNDEHMTYSGRDMHFPGYGGYYQSGP